MIGPYSSEEWPITTPLELILVSQSMEGIEEVKKCNPFLTKRRFFKVLLMSLLLLLAIICIFIIIYRRRRSQVTRRDLKFNPASTNGSYIRDIPPTPKASLKAPEEKPPGIYDLTLDQIKDPMTGEMSMLLFAEYIVNRDKCQYAPIREQLAKFFPATVSGNEGGFRLRTMWLPHFLPNFHHNTPAQIVDQGRIGKNVFVNFLESVLIPMNERTAGSNQTLIMKPFRHPLTLFYDPSILLSLQDELVITLEDDEELGRRIFDQAKFILNYRKFISLSGELRRRSPYARIFPDPNCPSQLDWQLWMNVCKWDTQRYILHNLCQVSFDGIDEEESFKELFLSFIKLPRASPWVIYLTWMSMMFHAKKQADIVQKHRILPRETASAFKQCYDQMMLKEASISEVIQCVESIPDSHSILHSTYHRQIILNWVPLWPEFMQWGITVSIGQNMEWLFISHHLNLSLLSSSLDNSFTKFPTDSILNLLGPVSTRSNGLNFEESISVNAIRGLQAFCQEHPENDRQIASLRRIGLSDETRRAGGDLPTILPKLEPESYLNCSYHVGLLHMQLDELPEECNLESFPTILMGIVAKYRTGSNDYNEEEMNLMVKVFQSDIYKKYVSHRLMGRTGDDLEHWFDDSSYLGSIDAALDFIFFADLARYHIIHHRLLPRLLPITSSFTYTTLEALSRSTEWMDSFRQVGLERYIVSDERLSGYGTLISLLTFFKDAQDDSTRAQCFQEYLEALKLLLDSVDLQDEFEFDI